MKNEWSRYLALIEEYLNKCIDNSSYGEEIVAPADPTMKGHKFEGWTPEVGAMTEEGMSFTAVWSKVTYDAIFMVDGEVYDTVPTVFGEEIVALAHIYHHHLE